MKKDNLLLLIILLSLFSYTYASGISPLYHTYSIVAIDEELGQIGVAVQSHWFSVGQAVSWAEAGVGAVATQSFTEVSYGPLGLQLMKSGKTAPEALTALMAIDKNIDVRQVAMIDSRGNIAVHTGNLCIPEAGHKTGKKYAVQANLMLKNTVWDAMAKAFETTQGELSDRLLAALEAAQQESGDIRGMQSASILVVSSKTSGIPWSEKIIDLRIEDHPQPLVELKRLLLINKAYNFMNKGDEFFAKGDIDAANKAYQMAEKLLPDNLEIKFWHAITLANKNNWEEALPLFKTVFAQDKNWALLVPRLPRAKLLPDDKNVIKKILSVSQ
ncbi:MAG: Zn-dependent protease [Candidatus Fischerbacteria bacterium RBG_13_37_8]|uniref:Zn-dependent protease n=1 Tax=Candidatus Fischerbacteria bacterium RBG_13_37_8 TaxID=1817863 RepID=A0A1F5VRI6_9BACT|nr:MAG: Zn-dependent protease [Candidatus Fischerbacteria bacterium RBG_13_37_8]